MEVVEPSPSTLVPNSMHIAISTTLVLDVGQRSDNCMKHENVSDSES